MDEKQVSDKKTEQQIKDEFIQCYKKDKTTSDDEHFVKLFNKTGKEIVAPNNDEKWLNDFKLFVASFFQEALKLDTVSFLFGTGSSVPLGAQPILKIPEPLLKQISDDGLKETHEKVFACYSDSVNLSFETYLGDLVRLENTYRQFGSDGKNKDVLKYSSDDDVINNEKLRKLISTIKKWLFEHCKVPATEKISDDFFRKDPLNVHREFIKKALTRPINLKRVNIFTTNYDLVFEKAMDELGVLYIDGFIGNIKRILKPEVYNYDFYFPASTTEGKVHRLDKVVHLYKLHGSINWLANRPSSNNIYGIEQASGDTHYNDALIIYPLPLKEEETLGFPYSEMFRRFASIIQQPQNVLIVYGYGFGDEHVNRVIYNALSISSFQLIIVSYGWTTKLKEFYEKVKDDQRVSFLIGEYLGEWRNFVMDILPDIEVMRYDEKIIETMKKLKGDMPSTQSTEVIGDGE